jgi:hypothetical protein
MTRIVPGTNKVENKIEKLKIKVRKLKIKEQKLKINPSTPTNFIPDGHSIQCLNQFTNPKLIGLSFSNQNTKICVITSLRFQLMKRGIPIDQSGDRPPLKQKTGRVAGNSSRF